MFNIPKVRISGMDVYPIIEGGKGIGVSTGATAGAFAAAGAVGTFSGACARVLDELGKPVKLVFTGKTRFKRFRELVQQGIAGGIDQCRQAFKISKGNGRIHINILWGMAGTEEILHGILNKTRGMLHGITCGAGMPFQLGEIASQYGVYYYPIVSSARTFEVLWKRAYHNKPDLLGGVVYEDPWVAGGHNGITNKENIDVPESPYIRVAELRKTMNTNGLQHLPIIMAGGVWYLKSFENWFHNEEIGPIAFQFGSRPLLTKESPVSQEWRQKMLTLKKGDVVMNKFSPTGFYSSAVNNTFLKELKDRSTRQIDYRKDKDEEFSYVLDVNSTLKTVFIKPEDVDRIKLWQSDTFTKTLPTPDNTLVFLTKKQAASILKDQRDCIGCLAGCKFGSWRCDAASNYSTGLVPDPRSFCIQKTLFNIIDGNDVENELLFSGANAWQFATDPLYSNGHIPDIQEFVDCVLTGN